MPTTEEETSLPLPCCCLCQILALFIHHIVTTANTHSTFATLTCTPMFCAGVLPSSMHSSLGILLLPCSVLLTNNSPGHSWQNQLVFLASQHLAGQTAALLFRKVKLQMAHPCPLYWQLLLLVLDMAAVESTYREHPPIHFSNPCGLQRASHMAPKCRVCGLCWADLDR